MGADGVEEFMKAMAWGMVLGKSVAFWGAGRIIIFESVGDHQILS